MARNKLAVHTTLSENASRILERYERELGAKNLVLEKALLNLDNSRFKAKHDVNNIDIKIKRISTGITGLDESLEGGIPKGFSVIITGPPGTGKTTFCVQILMERIRNNEKCVFFSFEEDAEHLVQQFMRYGWDIGDAIDNGYLEIFGMSIITAEEMTQIIDSYKPDIVVFDSLNVFTNPEEFRTAGTWRNVHRNLKNKKITSLMVTEKKHGIETKQFDDYDFLGDGIIFLDSVPTNDIDPTPMPVMVVQKMRSTKIDTSPQPFMFTENGIRKYGPVNASSKILRDRLQKNKYPE